LIGNFNDHPPTNAQYESLIHLITHLVREYKIPPEHVVGHKDVPFDHDPSQHERTLCPGKYLDIQDVRESVIERTHSDSSGMDERYLKIRKEL
jgi:N-acetylmuramoyl-L-alanine amidase